MDIAVLSVIYPGVEQYLNDFLRSLSKQTLMDFKLFLINDGVFDAMQLIKGLKCNFDIKGFKGTPSAIRKYGINWIINEGAEIILFADADDYFDENRLEASIKFLVDHDLVVNELLLFGDGQVGLIPMLGKRLREGENLQAKHLKYSNCMGFSNTAMLTNKISPDISRIPDHIIAFDWAFFTICLQSEINTVFTQKTKTYYRQHLNNSASPYFLSEEFILKGLRVKKDHYSFLSQLYKEYSQLAEVFEKLLKQLEMDNSLRQKYCRLVCSKSPEHPLWWESIKTIEELGL